MSDFKTEYDDIYFKGSPSGFGKNRALSYKCFNKRSDRPIGRVAWSKYKIWMYTPLIDAGYTISRLRDVVDFISQLKKLTDRKHKEGQT